MDKSDVLLGIIDDRCKKALKEANIPSKIVGTVVKVDSKNKKIDVKIAGYDTVFTLLNKSGEILSEGDNVFVESIKDNLTNGYISERFGEAVWASGASQDLSSYLQKNGDGKDVTVTYTESSSLSNITSGEKLSTMFGKIKKWFTNLKTVAFTGSYNDLIDKPEISTSGTLDTNNSSSLNVPTSPESFGNDIDLHKISKTGSYNDLNNKPTIPTKSSDLTNDAFVRYDNANQNLSNEQKLNARNNIGAGTSNFDGNYNSLTNKPNISSEYILPVATSTVLGGVKVGNNINIDSDGTISVSDTGNEVAVQSTTPENGEVLWIEDEDIESANVEYIADQTNYIHTGAAVDLNNYINQGWYFFTSTNTITNIPAGVNGWLQVIKDKSSGSWAKQIWYRAGTSNSNDYQTYVRTLMNGVWSNWKQYQMVEDTGWQNLTLDSKFHAYNDTAANTPECRKVGNVVYVRGVIAPVSNLDADSNTVFTTLPSGYRPSKEVHCLCQGTAAKIWLLTIYTNGNMSLAGYRNGYILGAVYADEWFPFDFTFLVD